MRGQEQTLGSGTSRKALGATGVMLSHRTDPGSLFPPPVTVATFGHERLKGQRDGVWATVLENQCTVMSWTLS